MAIALEEARRGLGLTSPNPPVGAVLVKGGKLLATGFHRRAGHPHAEIEAMRNCRNRTGAASVSQLRGATIYITLEPCSTWGRTPPCTNALIEAGLKRVVYGAKDPNPGHAGRAARVLRARGLEVRSGVMRSECDHLIRMFRKFILGKTPYVIAKSALTLDGRITLEKGGPRWISGPEARRDVQELRSQVDAVLIGGETLRRDNPRLTLRGEFARPRGPHPWRVILTRSGHLPSNSLVFNDKWKDRTLVYRGRSLRQVLRDLGRRGAVSVLIEAGGNLMGQAFKGRLVDEVRFYLTPIVGGGEVRAVAGSGFRCNLADLSFQSLGSDIRVSGFPVYPDKAIKTAR